jgi:hypothetical protein
LRRKLDRAFGDEAPSQPPLQDSPRDLIELVPQQQYVTRLRLPNKHDSCPMGRAARTASEAERAGAALGQDPMTIRAAYQYGRCGSGPAQDGMRAERGGKGDLDPWRYAETDDRRKQQQMQREPPQRK